MATVVWIILCAKLCSAVVLEDYTPEKSERQARLRLPTEYHFKGDVTHTDYEIMRPFEIWHSDQMDRSRMDTYEGTVKRFYYNENETVYTIYPRADGYLVSQTACASQPKEVDPEALLPSIPFIRSGRGTYYNKRVDVWKFSKVSESNVMFNATMITLRELENDIPVMYEQTKINLLNSAIFSHSVIRYYGFEELDPKDLTCERETDCDGEITDLTFQLKLSPDVEEAFARYKEHHNKKYNHDEEQEFRALMFERNWRLVTEHNSRNASYKLGLNKFSDRLPSELAHLTATRPGDPHAPASQPFPFSDQQLQELADELPDSYDMRLDGIISRVKNQGDCGSCWAFATVAAVEGALAKSLGGRLLDLSEQSLVDCGWYEGNQGCDGGFLNDSFEYVRKYGIPTELKYGEYLSDDGNCKYGNVSYVFTVKGFVKVPPMSPIAMKAALYHFGPVAATMNSMNDLTYYTSGVYNNIHCNDQPLNHAVTIVGYGDKDGTPYWIVKNSYGEDWGQDGYFYISAEGNNCHILEDAYYPIV